MAQRKKTQRQWYRMDLHLHTPASADYKTPNVTYLDFLKKAEEKNLDIIAFADHNSARGYANYLEEVESLELLERLKRLRDDERKRLDEYRHLREKMLILPGFEFTATLGFHILAIFPPETTVRELEHLLLSMHVPPDKLDLGSGEVGATTDALTAYRMIAEAGGMAIAAHANSSHGVAMPGFDFGGQTRIAYTQDANLLALEVTDLDSKSRRRTAAFFSGTKPEYPRKMHCIQGSDAHKLVFEPKFKNEMGVGDRATEILLDEPSFDDIKAVFTGNDFSRTRPFRSQAEEPFDPLRDAREQGDTLIQAFHEKLMDRRTVLRGVLQDIVALANTNGGTLYIGASANAHQSVAGIERVEQGTMDLRTAIAKNINPPIEVQIEVLKSQGKNVLQVIVPRGSHVPYALEDSYIYVRSENETGLAVRDEIIQLVRDTLMVEVAAMSPSPTTTTTTTPAPSGLAPAVVAGSSAQVSAPSLSVPPPRTGVEIVASDVRKGVWYFTVRDLRNTRVVHNVTLKSARRLWQYAIAESQKNLYTVEKIEWTDRIAIAKAYKRGGKVRYDLVQRVGDKVFVYYGVTEDGIHGEWRKLVEGTVGSEGEVPESLPEIAAEYDENAGLFGEPIGRLPEVEPAEQVSHVKFSLHEMLSEPEVEETEDLVELPFTPSQEEPLPPPEEYTSSEMPAMEISEPVAEESVSAPDMAMANPESQPTPEEQPATSQDQVTSAPQVEEESAMPPEQAMPVSESGEHPSSAIVPVTPPPAPVPVSKAQTWRERLNRAMEKARTTKDQSSE